MRIYIVALLASIGCLAQIAPKISFDSTHYNFGKIYGDRTVSHRFKVTNKGQTPLNIIRLDPSCGCTSTIVGQWTLSYNESTSLEIVVNPVGLCSSLRKSVRVVSNDPTRPITTLTFSAEILRDVMPSTNTIFFDNLTHTTTKKAYVTLVTGNNRPIHIKKIESHGTPYLSFATYKESNNIKLEVSINGYNIPNERCRGVDIIHIYTASTKSTPVCIAVQWELSISTSTT